MSLYKLFKTDEKLEREGIWLDYGAFRVRIARAGGANKPFVEALDTLMKPYAKALKAETIAVEKLMELIKRAYAKAVVLDWETNGQKGIEAPDGSLLPVTEENIFNTLTAVNDLFLDIRESAEKTALFRQVVEDAKA